MATIKRGFIFISCISSAIAALFTLLALVTEQWIITENAQWVQSNLVRPNTIKYGLFQGYYGQQEPTTLTLQVTMTCLLQENVCALLCGKTDESRYTLLRQLYNNEDVSQDDANCPSVQRVNSFSFGRTPVTSYADENSGDRQFLNAGVWLSTIFFLALSIAVGLVSSVLAIWNTVSNPVQVFFSIFGLYIYNAIALLCTVIAMCLWGVMHIKTMFHNVGIYYTIVGLMTSDKTGYLGYSYWILIIPIVCYCCSIALLYIRQYLLSKDPGHKMVQREDTADPGIYLY